MRFQSERECELRTEEARQMLSLVESPLQPMAPVQTEADFQAPQGGHILLHALVRTGAGRLFCKATG